MGEPVSSPIRVLIVDDQRMLAESLGRLLTTEGITVVGVAVTGQAALQLATDLRPDVVLVDYRLPDQDGAALVVEIKRRDPTIMAVMFTASAEHQVLLAAIDAGCSGFLTKDQGAAEVIEAVRAAAVGDSVVSPAILARLLRTLDRTPRRIGSDLTDRECEILNCLTRGLTNKFIADELGLSVHTIRNYVQSILTKMGAHSKLEAVSIAVREGIIDYPQSPHRPTD